MATRLVDSETESEAEVTRTATTPEKPRAIVKPTTTEERVQAVVERMMTGRWNGRATHRLLARKWDCTPNQVHYAARLAGAVIRQEGGPIHDWVEGKLAELDSIKAAALASVRTFMTPEGQIVDTPSPDFNAAIKAVELQLKAKGVLAAVRPEKVLPESGDGKSYETMSPEERIALHEAAIAEERQKAEARH